MVSCVGKKKYVVLEGDYANLQLKYDKMQKVATDCDNEKKDLQNQLRDRESSLMQTESELKSTILSNDEKMKLMEEELKFVKSTNTNLLDRLSDLSVINKTGAESIKKSLESINEQNRYIKDLSTNIQRKDSVNLALVMNLKRSLSNINDEDIQIEVKKGVVYVSLSDKLLFNSGSSNLNAQARAVLSKVSSVVNDHKNLEILVEGHTDNVPISNACVKDNWDLSVRRATEIVRILQTEYQVDPARLTAGGRSEFQPKTSNESEYGRKINRRTEIIITPKLDEFFELMVPAGG